MSCKPFFILNFFLLAFLPFFHPFNSLLAVRRTSGHGYYITAGSWQARYHRWPAYYAYYGYPFYGSTYYYSFPLNSSFYYSYPSYYTDYIYPSYPYNGYYYLNDYRIPSPQSRSTYYPSSRTSVSIKNYAPPSSKTYNVQSSAGVFLKE
jgi:hypothetical protein